MDFNLILVTLGINLVWAVPCFCLALFSLVETGEDNFPTTILTLGESNTLYSPFLCLNAIPQPQIQPLCSSLDVILNLIIENYARLSVTNFVLFSC